MSSQRATGSRWWLLPMLVALAVGLGGGAGYAVREVSATTDSGPSTAAPPATTTTTGDEPTDPTAVRLAQDVDKDPRRDQVLELLQRHFDAINSLDYDTWVGTVTGPRAAGMPKDRWLYDYQSTKDTGVVVHRIEPTPQGFVVLLSFVSEQLPELAPPDLPADCITWWVSYPVIDELGELRLGGSTTDANQKEAC